MITVISWGCISVFRGWGVLIFDGVVIGCLGLLGLAGKGKVAGLWSYLANVFAILAGDYLSLIAVGSGEALSHGAFLVPECFLPGFKVGYISVSSRWCLEMRKGVLLVMVVLV